MRKISTILGACALAAVGFSANAATGQYVAPMYLVGEVTNNEIITDEDTWTLYADDETSQSNVYKNTFTIPQGEFNFHFVYNGDYSDEGTFSEEDYVAVGPEGSANVNVTFGQGSQFAYEYTGNLAENSYNFTCNEWLGGSLYVEVTDNDGSLSILMYCGESSIVPSNPDVDGEDLYTITGPENGIITITWENDMVWTGDNINKSNVYLLDASGNEIILNRYISGGEEAPVVVPNTDDIPGYITIDLNLVENLWSGVYTLVVPEKYLDIISEDYEYWEGNPEITYEFNWVGDDPYVIDGPKNGIITVIFESEESNIAWNEENENLPYVTDSNGKKTTLKYSAEGLEQIAIEANNVIIDLNGLKLAYGNYVLTIPEGFVYLNPTEDEDGEITGVESPAIEFSFQWEEATSAVDSINAADNAPVVIYNLQGVRVSNDNLRPGLYIINGKKVAVK